MRAAILHNLTPKNRRDTYLSTYKRNRLRYLQLDTHVQTFPLKYMEETAWRATRREDDLIYISDRAMFKPIEKV